MSHHLFRIKSYLAYWLEAVDEHSLHSPFFYDLYTQHIKPSGRTVEFPSIERLREKLLRDQRSITVDDLGSSGRRRAQRKISRIARTSISTRRFSAMYYRIAAACRAATIVELGASFGINTLYLAENKEAVITTFEGAAAIADIAALTFEFANAKNIRLVAGDIDKTLPDYLEHIRTVDFVFMDANHRYEPTLRYFGWLLKKMNEKSVVVLDDIHYSPEMERAWTTLKNHRLVYGSADLFRCGILFFDPSLNKQHVILQV